MGVMGDMGEGVIWGRGGGEGRGWRRPGLSRRLEQAGRRVWRMGYRMPFKWAGGTLFSVCFSFAVYSNNYGGYSDQEDKQY